MLSLAEDLQKNVSNLPDFCTLYGIHSIRYELFLVNGLIVFATAILRIFCCRSIFDKFYISLTVIFNETETRHKSIYIYR